MIEVRNLTKGYGDTVVLDDVSLRIPRGGITSVIGANGAGKSTFLSIVGRLLEPEAGTVTIDGLDTASTPSRELARRVSILRQDNHLTVRLTVRELVTFGRFPHSRGRPGPADHRAIDDAIDYLELGPFADRHLDELSGGQRQRAFVAMVLCQETDYLLLDEPLNNLDLRHAVGMMRLFRRIADDLDRTILLVVHDINFASCHSDRIVAMRDGRLVADGHPKHIIDAPVLRNVFDTHVDVHDLDGDRIGVYFR
ncbi:ATP-binding cassette domain-containing protein [Egibacter rhizosphaerae]|uniref:ATP-binding cassette domain-containing protein n=1 Tax=Egibacter rhizosphaerae TaxID=1670831 RepID=A0A411YFD8_9ACTN|nr:ATP-binding cassette domain-containing protein [Egibacter rhizosphaerae]QBI19955.1 ATP-binding cassette domain-containing protein [Egibacter rhizosphaerae]